ncbi:probable RNA-directed DNA polymerase from transposon X-element [Trichonephila clavipes]|nr:probable RNA-directed DNA polymerase from transposon X-element [Trichonephila clavipes]
MYLYNKVLLYTAVLRPILSYGCPIWGYAANTNIKILETSQNSIIRCIVRACRAKFAANLAHTDVFTINALSSDHNPVIFDFITNNILPPILRTLKSTNWIKFQEILYHNVPGNLQIDNLDTAVQNFTDVITNAISASTSTRVINTPHLRLPENIRELIRAKNRFRKLWNNTRYQPYKREVNALIRQIRKEIEAHKNRTWKDLLLTLNPQDNSLYNLHRKITKRATVIPPLHGPGGMAYSDFEKAEAFKDTLEVTFQENVEPYCDDKIEEVENVVCNYFDNFTTLTPPLTSPIEVRGIIKRLQNRKAAGPDHIPNIALKYLTLNAITHLTKIYNQCLIKNHFPTQWKQANVVMLPKPNQDHKFSQNYRPISLLSTTAKPAPLRDDVTPPDKRFTPDDTPDDTPSITMLRRHTAKESTAPCEPQRTVKTPH